LGIFSFGKASSSIGLDIETNTFRVVQLKSSLGAPILANYGSIKVPVGAVVEGEVVDVDVVAQTITQLWKKTGLSEKKVVIGIANQKVVVRLVPFPFMEKNELKSAIQYQVQDFIPIPVDEAILDFDIVGEFTTEENERMIEVLLVAAQKDMVENSIAVLNKAGLKPQIIDVSSFALVRTLIDRSTIVPEEADEEAVALVNIGSGITNIAVVEKGIPRFTRVASLAGNNFTQRIADTMNISFDEAEELKVKIGLPSVKSEKKEASLTEPENVKVVQDVLLKEVNKFIGEVRRSIDYYLMQRPGIKNLKRIILSGNGASMKNLVPHLEKGLQVQVDFGHPLQKVKIGPKLSSEALSSEELAMAICLGLGLRGLEE
jgi:type IV pilus assembly protein PilM